METALNETQEITKQHFDEVSRGDRFEFGKNWARFLDLVNEERIISAEDSLREMLGTGSLTGKSFLDIGSGSGLFSLAARRLGASVHSFDFDPASFHCTMELKRRFFDGDEDWIVEQGSALDLPYIETLGEFDIVYSWGVLHHTGSMWEALANADVPVREDGKLFIAIYNDTGSQARRWNWIKKTYCSLPRFLKPIYAVIVIIPDEVRRFINYCLSGDPVGYIKYWAHYRNHRGMNRWCDIIDWVGGYPYEVATPDEIFEFFQAKNYRLTKLKCGGVGLGCNQFVFEKEDR